MEKKAPQVYLYRDLSPESKYAAFQRYLREEVSLWHTYPSTAELMDRISDVIVEFGVEEAVKALELAFRATIRKERLEAFLDDGEHLFNEDGDMVEIRIVN